MMRRNLDRTSAFLPALLCAALLLVSCDTSLSIDIGGIRVSVTTIGSNLDPDGYTIRVTGGSENQSQPVAVQGQVVFAVPAGRYVVEQLDKAANCVTDFNPQAVQVSAGRTAELTFNTLCG